MAGLVHHGDVGAHALPGQFDVPQPVLAAPEARCQRGLAAVLEHEQVLFEPQPPIPALTTAPGDQVGAAVKPIPHQHRLGARREKTCRRLKRRALLGKAEPGAAGTPPRPSGWRCAPEASSPPAAPTCPAASYAGPVDAAPGPSGSSRPVAQSRSSKALRSKRVPESHAQTTRYQTDPWQGRNRSKPCTGMIGSRTCCNSPSCTSKGWRWPPSPCEAL